MQLCFLPAEPRKFQCPYLGLPTFRAATLRIGSAADVPSYTVWDNTSFRSIVVMFVRSMELADRYVTAQSRVSARISVLEVYSST